jgi:hypothetical protein
LPSRRSSIIRAAAKLGVSQSALSHMIRSVAPRLQVEPEIAAFSELGGKAAGSIRITAFGAAMFIGIAGADAASAAAPWMFGLIVLAGANIVLFHQAHTSASQAGTCSV